LLYCNLSDKPAVHSMLLLAAAIKCCLSQPPYMQTPCVVADGDAQQSEVLRYAQCAITIYAAVALCCMYTLVGAYEEPAAGQVLSQSPSMWCIRVLLFLCGQHCSDRLEKVEGKREAHADAAQGSACMWHAHLSFTARQLHRWQSRPGIGYACV
jgi:uncharacterized membrane protein (DUF4010 family)